jgi:hypothetical protein
MFNFDKKSSGLPGSDDFSSPGITSDDLGELEQPQLQELLFNLTKALDQLEGYLDRAGLQEEETQESENSESGSWNLVC